MRFLQWTGVAISIVIAPPGWASDEKPAVSTINGFVSGSFAASGAAGESARALLGGGQLTVPIGEAWGARMNVNAGAAFGSGTDGAEAAAGNLAAFWRRPETGFVQVRGFGSHFGSVDLYGGDASGRAILRFIRHRTGRRLFGNR